MSFNIPEVAATSQVSAAAPTGKTKPAKAPPAESSVQVDTIPSSPPADVHKAMAVAAQAPDRLAAANRALHFRVDDRSGKFVVEVHDLAGKVLFTVPPSKALDVAAGGSLE